MKKEKLVPLFPLSGVILFPETNLPLNIFEKRYIEMVDYALSNDKIIGMIQEKENGELYNIGCLGRITSYDETEDGRYVINLIGVSYFSILKEKNSKNKFRLFEVLLKNLNNKNKDNFKLDRSEKELLLSKYQSYINDKIPELNFDFVEKIKSDLLLKFIAMTSPFSSNDKQMLLETHDLYELAKKLIILFDFYIKGENKNVSMN